MDDQRADPLSYVAALVSGLQHATPEVTEHLARAGYELLLAAKAVMSSMSEAVAQAEGRPSEGSIESIPIRRP